MNDIVRERRGITPDTALRLAAYFGGDAASWLNLQQTHDLKITEAKVAKLIAKQIQPLEHASNVKVDARVAVVVASTVALINRLKCVFPSCPIR